MTRETRLSPRRDRRFRLRAFRVLCAGLFAQCFGASPALAQVVEIGIDRILRVEGIPVFPIGVLELGLDAYPTDWNQRLSDANVNVVWDTGRAYADSTPTCEAIRDSSLAGGYFMLTGSPNSWAWDDLGTPELEVAQPMYAADSLAEINACFPFWANHIGYTNRDEAEWTISQNLVGDIDSAHVHATYAQLKASQLSKIVAMNFANTHLSGNLAQWKSDNAGFVPATDVVMSACYPYPSGPGTCGTSNVFGPSCSMDRLWQSADVWRNELAVGKPLWMILQAHKGIPLKESRWTATQAVIHGATGLFWAGWNWVHPDGDGSANWPTIRQVISEFADLEQILLQPTVPSVVSLEPNVDVLAKLDPGDEFVILAATRNGFVGQATIQMPGVLGHWVEVRNEGRYLPIVGEEITDAFSGYEAHAYQVKSIGFDPTVAAPVVSGGAPSALRWDVFPNPATEVVSARLYGPEGAAPTVTVHDVAGRLVGQAEVRSGSAGSVVTWDARDASGRRAVPGLYFLRAQTPQGVGATARVTLR